MILLFFKVTVFYELFLRRFHRLTINKRFNIMKADISVYNLCKIYYVSTDVQFRYFKRGSRNISVYRSGVMCSTGNQTT